MRARRLAAAAALAAAVVVLPAPARADEGTAQLLAGNVDPQGKPLPGYLDFLAAAGVDGTGVRVAVVDSGVDTTHPDLDDRVVEVRNYSPLPIPVDELGHGTHVAGIIAGHPDRPGAAADVDGLALGQGLAPGAELISMNPLGLRAYGQVPLRGIEAVVELIPGLARDAVRSGATIWNASWATGEGLERSTTTSARMLDAAARDADPETPGDQPLTLVFAAANAGPKPRTIGAPPAKNVILVGASTGHRGTAPAGTIMEGSSRGPLPDGRLAPTVVAPGVLVASARAGTGFFACYEPLPDAARHALCTGTSMATPHVAGALALVTQAWRRDHGGATPSPAMAAALLVNTARDLGEPDVPNTDEGWGQVDLRALLTGDPGARIAADQEHRLTAAGQRRRLYVVPADPAQPLRATLAWTDVPAPVAEDPAAPALVHDLDLRVDGAGGPVLGNVFRGGFSARGGAADRLHTIEHVKLAGPGRGARLVEVRAAALPDGASQDYALVVSNARPIPAPDLARITARAAWRRAPGGRTAPRRLVLGRVPAGATVKVSCGGKGCRGIRATRHELVRARRTLDVTRAVRRARLARGSRITVRLTAPGLRARTVTWRAGARPGKPARADRRSGRPAP